jgi:hypothetical protein
VVNLTQVAERRNDLRAAGDELRAHRYRHTPSIGVHDRRLEGLGFTSASGTQCRALGEDLTILGREDA